MDMFECGYPNFDTVDLDDLNTYNYQKKSMTTSELNMEIRKKLGESLYYMQYFHPEYFQDYLQGRIDSQYARVDVMCRDYSKRWRSLLDDTPENRLELLKMLFKLEDEVENQC
jgi:hypothetical protein